MVVKKDGTRERFDRQKLIAGLLKACEKRPVSVAALEAIADRVEATLQERPEKEIATADIGALRDGGAARSSTRWPTCASRRSTGTSATSASS